MPLNKMHPIKRFLTSPLNGLLITLLILSSPASAKVAALLSNNSVAPDQPVRLTLQMEGEDEMNPDLSELEARFDILGRSTQQSISIVNGKMSAKRSLALTLLPKQTGRIEIPPIRIGQESTQALVLEVAERSQEEKDAESKQVLLELSLSKPKAYIEEEVLLTLRLFQAPGIRAEALTEPQPSMPDTQLRLLHEESYQSERDGINYLVVERTYALFAYQSGTLEIGGVKYRGRSGKDRIFSFLNDPFNSSQPEIRQFRSESNRVELEVVPIPQNFTGDRWLPAKNLQVVESGLAQQSAIIAGKPVVRRIMVFADGLTTNQLPILEQTMPEGLKLYHERPQLKETPARTGISSSRQSGMTLIATEPGRYDLPEVEIPWWNIETDRQEVARLEAVTIEVVPNPGGASDPQPQPPQYTPEQTIRDDNETIASSDQAAANGSRGETHWLVWLFGAAWVVTLFGWWYTRRSETARPRQVEPAEVDKTAVDPGKQAIAEALARLEAAYADQDAVSARAAWLHWAQLQWPDNPPHNLTRLATRCDNAVSQAVLSLERAIYSPLDEPGWAEFEVRLLIEQTSGEKRAEKPTDGLVPLNP
ncbi:MAG: BatD family protein [Candidatus Thiodiazotropha sp. (ex Ctena orbiculata)]|nr:BatD family protein [Candidatus Thiodiazotropha taylori]MBT3036426.1 BatD family protein [Candidatus Thiodiazotropha taylori]